MRPDFPGDPPGSSAVVALPSPAEHAGPRRSFGVGTMADTIHDDPSLPCRDMEELSSSGNRRHTDLSLEPPPAALHELEERVQRLETALVPLGDIATFEGRLLAKVRIPEKPASSEEHVADRPLPAPVPAPDISLPQRKWLVVELFDDVRTMAAMVVDRRFRLGWGTWAVLIMCLPALVLSSWWFPPAWIPVVGWAFVKVADLLLAFCIWKALAREARRYEATYRR